MTRHLLKEPNRENIIDLFFHYFQHPHRFSLLILNFPLENHLSVAKILFQKVLPAVTPFSYCKSQSNVVRIMKHELLRFFDLYFQIARKVDSDVTEISLFKTFDQIFIDIASINVICDDSINDLTFKNRKLWEIFEISHIDASIIGTIIHVF